MKNKIILSGERSYRKYNPDMFECKKCKRHFPIADKDGEICKKCKDQKIKFVTSR